MKPVSASRSALFSALAGTATVAGVLLLTALVSVQDTAHALRTGTQQIDLTAPSFTGGLIVGPVVLILSFAVFYAIGWRAARPIEAARRAQLQFTADASHELRTPLTLIEGEASLALGRPRRPAEYRRSLEMIDAESRRMRRLVDDLLWLARTDSGPDRPDFVDTNLDELVMAGVGRFQGVAATKGLRLSVTPSEGARPSVRAPSDWMDRLIGVLLDNSCRYTPRGGVIRAQTATSGTFVYLRVEDSGPGIPVEEKDSIFDRFHRATDSPGGAGLGLAIASRVVAETHGWWKVGRSSLGGAQVEVRWPVRRGPRMATWRLFKDLSKSKS